MSDGLPNLIYLDVPFRISFSSPVNSGSTNGPYRPFVGFSRELATTPSFSAQVMCNHQLQPVR